MLLALPIFLAVFFVLFYRVDANSSQDSLIINEVLINGNNGEEFIELYNNSTSDIPLQGWYFNYYSSSRDWNSPYRSKEFPVEANIKAKDFYIIGLKGFDLSKANWQPYITDQLSNSNGSVAIFKNNIFSKDAVVDVFAWGVVGSVKEIKEAPVSKIGFSLGRIDGKNTNDNSKDFAEQEPTPGQENKKIEEKIPDPPKAYSDKIQITELFPNPFNSKYEEYIELYNGTPEKIDLVGWTLRDASMSGKHTFLKSSIIEARKYLAVFKNEFSFALNNSGEESVTLFDPNGKEVSSVSYDGSKQNASYDFDGIDWHWSKFLTPGEENIFNNQPYGTVVIDDDIFVNVYADFSVSTGDADGEEVKVVWDFGDGHKSYLAKTRHKYAETGKYSASMKMSDGSEEVVKNFTVEVGEIPHPKVRIIAVNANPKGTDSSEESLTIENKSNKKVNLNGWSIATGWKKFINHPIREDVVIKKGKTVEVTHDVSSFTLNNTKAKIRLRYPDGKVAHEVKYKKIEGIKEGQVFQHKKGGWVWLEAKQDAEDNMQNATNNGQNAADNEQGTIINEQETKTKIQETNNIQKTKEEDENSVKIWRKTEKEGVQLPLWELNSQIGKTGLIKNQPRVLGAETVREADGKYFFTPQTSEKHYLVLFWERLLVDSNASLNKGLNGLQDLTKILK